MELRCSPCYRLLFFAVLGMLIFCGQTVRAQCNGEFSYQFVSPENNSNTGKIEISLKNPDPGFYTINLYKMEGKIIPVDKQEVSSPEKIVFERLAPATYFIKIEWGSACRRILGGLEGIILTAKDQER